VLPLRYYQTKPATDRALLTTAAMPGQTLTVGPRVPPAARAAITRALLSPEGQQIMQPLAARGTPQAIVPADKPDYAGLSELLHQIWGFDS
jgi:ABC-type phosphate/phosphonate transport system substrate-binding protein